MTSLELARWQFGITTVYHFLFVPVKNASPIVTGTKRKW